MQTIQVRPSRIPRWQKRGGWEVYETDGVAACACLYAKDFCRLKMEPETSAN